LFVAQQGEFFVGLALGSFLRAGQAVFDEAGAGVALVDEGANEEGGYADHDEDY
jgi:hypothetical protein